MVEGTAEMVMGSVHYDLTSEWAVMTNVGWQQSSKFGQVDVTLVDQGGTASRQMPITRTRGMRRAG